MDARIAAGSQAWGSFQSEIAGNVQLTPALAVRPLVEYFVGPDNLNDVHGKRQPSAGFEVGVFTVISLGSLIGDQHGTVLMAGWSHALQPRQARLVTFFGGA